MLEVEHVKTHCSQKEMQQMSLFERFIGKAMRNLTSFQKKER